MRTLPTKYSNICSSSDSYAVRTLDEAGPLKDDAVANLVQGKFDEIILRLLETPGNEIDVIGVHGAMSGHLWILKKQLEYRHITDVNQRDRIGNTLLLAAVDRNLLHHARYLLHRGADVNAFVLYSEESIDELRREDDMEWPNSTMVTFAGYSALHIAARLQYGDMAMLLIQNGADVHARILSRNEVLDPGRFASLDSELRGRVFFHLDGRIGWNLLHTLSGDLKCVGNHGPWNASNDELVQILLDLGVDVNAVTTLSGRTPLHLVAMHPYSFGGVQGPAPYSFVEALLARGADWSMHDASGDSVWDLAVRSNSFDVRLGIVKKRIKDYELRYGPIPEHLGKLVQDLRQPSYNADTLDWEPPQIETTQLFDRIWQALSATENN